MTGAILDVTGNAGQVGEALDELLKRAGNLRDPLAEIGELLLPSIHQRFNQGVAPDGSPWAPLAPSTLARKKGPGILRESLHLQGSFRYQVGNDELLVGTNVPYAAAHQFGLPAHTIRPKSGKALMWPGAKHPVKKVEHPGLKARPFLGLSIEDEAAILDVVKDYLAGG